MKTRVLLILSLAGLLLTFQNCGQPGAGSSNSASSGGTSSQDETIGSTASYTRITHALDVAAVSVNSSNSVQIDLTQATVSLNSVSCPLDQERLQEFKDLLASSQVCTPAPAAAGSAICQAIAAPDIELSNGSSDVMLSPNVCNNGVFLCAGQDAKLRALIQDVQSNPPAGCSSSLSSAQN